MARTDTNVDIDIISKNNYPILLIDNFYNKKELKEIWIDLDKFNLDNYKDVWQSNLNDINRATDKKNNPLAKNSRIYLDKLYPDNLRNTSFILKNYLKIMSKEILDIYKEIQPCNRNIYDVNVDYTMVSYYKNNEEYKYHSDRATMTALWWTYKEPKGFTGGDLSFKDNDIKINCKNNRLIMFPSFYLHASSKVKLKNKKDNLSSKYTISHFYNINI